jgi:tetratricopeptide (TPR) repeat protein
MARCSHFSLSIIAALLIAGIGSAQNVALDDPPKEYPKKPETQQQRDQRQSLYHFIEGLAAQREDRLLEALKAFQEAARLDPQSAAVFKAQVPILIALERGPDALEACGKVVERNADDVEAWMILARLHKAMAHYAEARQALEKGLRVPGLEDRPELAQQMHFDLGALYEADEKFGLAADAYTHAASLLDHPDVIAEHASVGKDLVMQRAAEIHERIGDLYRKVKKYDQAAAAYVKAQERMPARAERLNFNLAQTCEEKGDNARAIAYLDAYLRTLPLGMDAYEMKIALLRRIRNEGAIVPWLEQSAKLDMHNVGLRLLLARECGRARQVPRAEQIYRAVAETSPSADLYRGLFHLYEDDAASGMARAVLMLDQTVGRAARKSKPDTGRAAQAKAMLAALRDDGELARAMIVSGVKLVNKGTELHAETMQLLAILAEKNRQFSEAERYYRGCLKDLTPEAETAVYSGLIRVLGKARKFEAQLAVCDGALSGDVKLGFPKAQATNQLLFLSEKARALAGLRRYDDAVTAAERALLLATDNNKFLMRHLRVRLLLMADRHAEAEKECEALLKDYAQPGEALETRYLLSNVYSAAKQMMRSEEQLLLILKADPDCAAANNDLGYLWADQGKRLEEAEQLIRKAIAVDRRQRQGAAAPPAPGEPAPPPPITPVAATSDPEVEDNAAYIDSLGWVLFRRGQVERARKELERAVALPDGDDPVIWDHLGDVCRQLQMPAEARGAWEHAIRLFDQGLRRRDNDRYQELQRKVKMP